MKKDEVTIGATYGAKVGSKTVDVRIESENAKGGWNAVAVATGKPVRIKDARQLRAAAATDGDRTVEPVDEGHGAADSDLVPLTTLDKEKRRTGRKAKGATARNKKTEKPPKAKAPKERKPNAMSCLDAAAAVLKAKGEPMRCKEMVAEMKEKGLWTTTTAPTPEATLYSAILRELGKGTESRFKKTDRGHFGLNTK